MRYRHEYSIYSIIYHAAEDVSEVGRALFGVGQTTVRGAVGAVREVHATVLVGDHRPAEELDRGRLKTRGEEHAKQWVWVSDMIPYPSTE